MHALKIDHVSNPTTCTFCYYLPTYLADLVVAASFSKKVIIFSVNFCRCEISLLIESTLSAVELINLMNHEDAKTVVTCVGTCSVTVLSGCPACS